MSGQHLNLDWLSSFRSSTSALLSLKVKIPIVISPFTFLCYGRQAISFADLQHESKVHQEPMSPKVVDKAKYSISVCSFQKGQSAEEEPKRAL